MSEQNEKLPKFIEINGQKYLKLTHENPKAVFLEKITEYVNNIDVKRATSDQVRFLTEVAKKMHY